MPMSHQGSPGIDSEPTPSHPPTCERESAQLPASAPGDELRFVLDALTFPIVVRDAVGAVRHANSAACAMLGRTPEELIALDAAGWQDALIAVFGDGAETVAAGSSAEPPARPQTVGIPRRTYSVESRPVQGADGSIAGRVELFRDVTEQERAEERATLQQQHQAREMAALQARLEQAEKFKLELTANVSHDLRTPLASIKASVSGLLAGDVAYDPDVLRDTLTVIEEETDRLQRRVQNLLSMSRMEAGDAIQHRDWLDITDVIHSALEALRSIRGNRPVKLQFDEDLPLVLGDYDQLQIAIRNLIENAFLYSPAEEPVEVRVSVSMGQLRVRVRDYGPGLMPDEAEQVFEKFYRGRSVRRIPGTGLGLPICRGIAEAHGGRLWAEHAAGGGVVFVLSIPLDQGEGDLDTEGGNHLDTERHR